MATTQPEEILLPAKPLFILMTLLAALLINLLPWAGFSMWFKPDFVALTLTYWCIHQPRRVGFSVEWILGLLMDVAHGNLFGQYALAYCVLAFTAITLHRRVLMFSIYRQVLHVVPLLLVAQVLILLVQLATGAALPGLQYFLGSLVGGLLWPPLAVLLELPQRLKTHADRV
jgi:rod shape-determining protein MreD